MDGAKYKYKAGRYMNILFTTSSAPKKGLVDWITLYTYATGKIEGVFQIKEMSQKN